MSNPTGMCPHCGKIVEVRSTLTATHDYPPLTRQVCPGSSQNPRCAESDARPLWNGKPNPHFGDAPSADDLLGDETRRLLNRPDVQTVRDAVRVISEIADLREAYRLARVSCTTLAAERDAAVARVADLEAERDHYHQAIEDTIEALKDELRLRPDTLIVCLRAVLGDVGLAAPSTPAPAEGMRQATADDVVDEVERRLRDVDWSSAAEDRCRVALLHIDAYRNGKARAPSTPAPAEETNDG